MVRMAQTFTFRMPLIDGQGNFGSVDGDPPAAMRYTEARMHKITEELIRDLDKDTVDFVPTYDESNKELLLFRSGFHICWLTVIRYCRRNGDKYTPA